MLISNQLELRHLRYFLAVAEELHFRKAADKLFISQPGLSRQVRQMEEVLGVSLFVRDKKRVRLTEAGKYFKEEVIAIINRLEQNARQLQHIQEGRVGEIRIGFLGSAMQNVVPKMLLQLQDGHPDIQTTLLELANGDQVDALLKNQLDLGFVRLAKVPPQLQIKPVFRDSFSLVLPQDYPQIRGDFKGVSEMAKENFILFQKEYSPMYYETVLSICEDAGFTPTISHKTVHAHTIFKLVENKFGVAIVPSSLRYGFDMKVRFVELRGIPQKAVLSVIWKAHNPNPVFQKCIRPILGI
ncbi:MAG: LysR substrate-binding domain-containing protein [Flavobacteriaceae bacterium]